MHPLHVCLLWEAKGLSRQALTRLTTDERLYRRKQLAERIEKQLESFSSFLNE